MSDGSGQSRGGHLPPHSPPGRRRSSRGLQGVKVTRQVELEKVLGITISSNSALTCDPNSGLVAYPAGCVIVLLCPRKNKQTHIFNTCSKPLSALSFSPDGKYIASGESGHKPAVRVWDVAEKTLVSEMVGHKYGVSCVCFSPNMKYVVSVGYQHDMVVNVWDWKVNNIVAKNKVSSKVTAVSFSEDNSYFVTGGNRHVRFWYMETSKKRQSALQVNGTVPLVGRSGLLGDLHNNIFCGVACGKGANAGNTFCITSSGVLCLFSDKRVLEKWIKLKVSASSCLSVTEKLVFCGCEDGVVRMFNAQNLQYLTDLPKPHFLGVDVTLGLDPSALFAKQPKSCYPDTCALVYDELNQWLCCVYNDHSLYVWDVNDTKKVGKVYSALYHSSYVWNVEVYPEVEQKPCVPHGSFFTCASDNTIRLWNTERSSNPNLKRNIYSHDLLKVIYVDNNIQYLRDYSGTADKSDPRDPKSGIRVLKVRLDGQHLASGDRAGNIRIYDLGIFDEFLTIEAHDGEILCLEYSKPLSGVTLLASASRDRLIHVLNVESDYSLMQTLDDHSSSITAVKFAGEDDQMHMISCGADKSIYFRPAQILPDGVNFIRLHHSVEKTTLYDMDVDVSQKTVAVACQDKNIRLYNILSGKQEKALKGSPSGGALLKVQMDPSGTFFATSCSNKNISLFDLHSGECVAVVYGHADIVTDMKFTYDCKRLITVSGDSCVFIWRLDSALTTSMRQHLEETAPKTNRVETHISHLLDGTAYDDFFMDKTCEVEDPTAMTPSKASFEADPSFLQTNGKLPLWVRKLDREKQDPSSLGSQNTYQPRGRWAQCDGNIAIKNLLDSESQSCFSTPYHDKTETSFLDDVTDVENVEPKNLQHLLEQSEDTGHHLANGTFTYEMFMVMEDTDAKCQSSESAGDIYYPSSLQMSQQEESDFSVEVHHTLSETFDVEDGESMNEFVSRCLQDEDEEDFTPSDICSEADADDDDLQDNSQPQSPEQQRFFMEHFGNLTDAYTEEKFDNTLKDLKPTEGDDSDLFLNPRLSISSKFLSLCQKSSRQADASLPNGQQPAGTTNTTVEAEQGRPYNPRKSIEKPADYRSGDLQERRKSAKGSDLSKTLPSLQKLPSVDKAASRSSFPGCWPTKDLSLNKSSRAKSYMEATASSKAKICRSVSMGENINTSQVEDPKKPSNLCRPVSSVDLYSFEPRRHPLAEDGSNKLLQTSTKQDLIPPESHEAKVKSSLSIPDVSDHILMPPPATCGLLPRLKKKAKSVSNLSKANGKDEQSGPVPKQKCDAAKRLSVHEKTTDFQEIPKRRFSSAHRMPDFPDSSRRFSVAEFLTHDACVSLVDEAPPDPEPPFCMEGMRSAKRFACLAAGQLHHGVSWPEILRSQSLSIDFNERAFLPLIVQSVARIIAVYLCESAIDELHGAFQKTLKVYNEIERDDVSHEEKAQLRSLFSKAFDDIRSEIDLLGGGGQNMNTTPNGMRYQNPTLDLLEHYSEMMLKLMREKIGSK
ncbi:WD repeat-containing protein 62-like [Spea bombifrons]|uniref:WD repeat-containing protein 62-like n=1 Tax=Spea bombifrons TaxID=233779 RepID=UPI002348FAF0|nr:WD repeat-containing protein 62-like [Spea bombifrons]